MEYNVWYLALDDYDRLFMKITEGDRLVVFCPKDNSWVSSIVNLSEVEAYLVIDDDSYKIPTCSLTYHLDREDSIRLGD